MTSDDRLFDFEVHISGPFGDSVKTIGFSPTPAEAESRAIETSPGATKIVVGRVLLEHAPRSSQLSSVIQSWEQTTTPGLGGQFFILRDKNNRLAAREFEGGHMLTAWTFLCASKPEARWKTLLALEILRQAIREDRANGNDQELDELLGGPPSRERVRSYLQGARSRDLEHHGQNTF